MILSLPDGGRFEGTFEDCTNFAQHYGAAKPPASELDAIPAGGHTAELLSDAEVYAREFTTIIRLPQGTLADMTERDREQAVRDLVGFARSDGQHMDALDRACSDPNNPEPFQ